MFRSSGFFVIILSAPSICVGMMGGHGMHGSSARVEIPAFDVSKLPNADSRPAKLFQSICTQCHNLPSPAMHTAKEWENVVPRMVGNMRRAMMVRVPSKTEQTAITDYLKTHAQQAFDASSNIDLNTPAGAAFKRICSRCHELPSPSQHTRDEWPSVLDRMNTNMRNMEKSLPTSTEAQQILELLQNNSKK